MSDPLINPVSHSPRVRDALKKPEREQKQNPRQQKKERKKRDSKRIIDTYA